MVKEQLGHRFTTGEFRLEGPTIPIDSRFSRGRIIGKGASGTVYEGLQHSINRRVAIKVLNPKHTDIYRKRFEREAVAVATLNHPNCITIHDYGYDEDLDYLYMVMEFVEGDTLRSLLRQHLSLEQTIHIATQILSAIDHAHSRGILHRDLKPGNIVITDDGTVKVLDFGMAAITKTDDLDQKITRDGAVYGTPPYMSPEQCDGKMVVDHRSDLYSFGIILYEMLEGRRPFRSNRMLDILLAHTHERAPRVASEHAPTELADIVDKLLAKAPDDRFQSAMEVKIAIESMSADRFRNGAFSTPISTPVEEVIDTWDSAEELEVDALATDSKDVTDTKSAPDRLESRTRFAPLILVSVGLIFIASLVAVLNSPDEAALVLPESEPMVVPLETVADHPEQTPNERAPIISVGKKTSELEPENEDTQVDNEPVNVSDHVKADTSTVEKKKKKTRSKNLGVKSKPTKPKPKTDKTPTPTEKKPKLKTIKFTY